MQTNIKQNQSQQNVQRLHHRIGAMLLIAGMVGGTVAISQEARRVVAGLAMHPAFAVIEHSGKESETSRHAVRLDDALRAPYVSGGLS